MSSNQFEQHPIPLLTFHVLLYQSSVIHHSSREGLISIVKCSIYYDIGFFFGLKRYVIITSIFLYNLFYLL